MYFSIITMSFWNCLFSHKLMPPANDGLGMRILYPFYLQLSTNGIKLIFNHRQRSLLFPRFGFPLPRQSLFRKPRPWGCFHVCFAPQALNCAEQCHNTWQEEASTVWGQETISGCKLQGMSLFSEVTPRIKASTAWEFEKPVPRTEEACLGIWGWVTRDRKIWTL